MAEKLGIEFLMSRFNEEFPGSTKNAKFLIDFAKDLGVQVDLDFDAINGVMANLNIRMRENAEKIKATQLQLDELKKEETELGLKKLRLEDFINEMRTAGVLGASFEEDPF